MHQPWFIMKSFVITEWVSKLWRSLCLNLLKHVSGQPSHLFMPCESSTGSCCTAHNRVCYVHICTSLCSNVNRYSVQSQFDRTADVCPIYGQKFARHPWHTSEPVGSNLESQLHSVLRPLWQCLPSYDSRPTGMLLHSLHGCGVLSRWKSHILSCCWYLWFLWPLCLLTIAMTHFPESNHRRLLATAFLPVVVWLTACAPKVNACLWRAFCKMEKCFSVFTYHTCLLGVLEWRRSHCASNVRKY